MVFRGFWLVSMVFQVGFMVFHGFWSVSMVFQGGFMVFAWFLWFFKVADDDIGEDEKNLFCLFYHIFHGLSAIFLLIDPDLKIDNNLLQAFILMTTC